MTTLEVDTPPQLDRHIRSVRDAAERITARRQIMRLKARLAGQKQAPAAPLD